jgi:phosphate transport system protein
MARFVQKELDRLKRELLRVSALVEEQVAKSVRSIRDRNEELAREVIDRDQVIDLAEVEVEEGCLKILALYQPVAVDLRFVVMALKINNDLERIGDLACNIAARSVYLAKLPTIEIPFDFEGMADKTRSMLRSSLDSLIYFDTDLATQVCDADEEVDTINRKMYDRVFVEIKKSPTNAEALIHYLSVSRYLERIADYATNIAEDVIYMIKGNIIRHTPGDE